MLSTVTAESHGSYIERPLATFKPEEEIYRCLSCGRYFDQLGQWHSHDELYLKHLGDYHPTKFVIRIDQHSFVVIN